MKSILNSAFLTVYSVLFFYAFATPVHVEADEHVGGINNWEIFVNQADPIAFFGYIAEKNGSKPGMTVSNQLSADTLQGSTIWVKGNLYPNGTVDPETLTEPPEELKIGEWYCTGTRSANPLKSPFGSLYEITDFTYAFNDGKVIHTKQINYAGLPAKQHVLYSEVEGIKAGDVLINGGAFFDDPVSPTRILVNDIKKIE